MKSLGCFFKITILLNLWSTILLASSSSEALPLLKQNLYEQCIHEICGTTWPNIYTAYDEARAHHTSVPPAIELILKNDTDRMFSLFETFGELLTDHSLSPGAQPLSVPETNFISGLILLTALQKVGFEVSRSHGLVFDREKFSIQNADFPQLIKAAEYVESEVSSFKVYNQFLLINNKSANAFFDQVHPDGNRKAALAELVLWARSLLKGANLQIKKEPRVVQWVHFNLKPSFFSVMEEQAVNESDIDDFVGCLLKLDIYLDLIGSQKLATALAGLNIEDYFRQKVTSETKSNIKLISQFKSNNIVEYERLKSRVFDDLKKRISFFYHTSPDEEKIAEFKQIFHETIEEMRGVLTPAFSRLKGDELSPLLSQLEIATIAPRSKILSMVEQRSQKIDELLGFWSTWKENKFVYFLILNHLVGDGSTGSENLFDKMTDYFYPADEFEAGFSPLEASYPKGPIIRTGWHAPHFGRAYKGILYHEVGHKIQNYLEKKSASLNQAEGKHLKGIISCLHQQHPGETFLSEPLVVEGSEISLGHYFSEDFADGISGLVKRQHTGVPNESCFFFSSNTELSPQDLDRDSGDKNLHSTDFFRLLHMQQVRAGSLPPACAAYLPVYHHDRSFADCFAELSQK